MEARSEGKRPENNKQQASGHETRQRCRPSSDSDGKSIAEAEVKAACSRSCKIPWGETEKKKEEEIFADCWRVNPVCWYYVCVCSDPHCHYGAPSLASLPDSLWSSGAAEILQSEH